MHDETTTGTAGTTGQNMTDQQMTDQQMTGRDMPSGDIAGSGMAGSDMATPYPTGADTGAGVGTGTGGDDSALFAGDDARLFQERWQKVQARFVDDPRGAVQDADSLVSDVTHSLTSRFAQQKTTLEQQWSAGDDVDTEQLRMTLQRYRTLFERLLAA